MRIARMVACIGGGSHNIGFRFHGSACCQQNSCFHGSKAFTTNKFQLLSRWSIYWHKTTNNIRNTNEKNKIGRNHWVWMWTNAITSIAFDSNSVRLVYLWRRLVASIMMIYAKYTNQNFIQCASVRAWGWVCVCARHHHHDALIFWSIFVLFVLGVDGDTNKTHMWMKYPFFPTLDFRIVVYIVNIDAWIGKGCWLVCWTMMRHRLHQQQQHDNSIIPDDIGKNSFFFSHHRHHLPIKFTVC